jgi:hypothetical protein
MSRTCPKCSQEKDENQFYQGKEKRCKSCMAEKYNKWVNSEKGRIKRNEINLKYTRSENGHIASRKAGKKYREKIKGDPKFKKDPIKKRAAEMAAYHARQGNIKKTPCKICGSLNVMGHHEDYNKLLEVIWLCPRHHTQWHAEKKLAL